MLIVAACWGCSSGTKGWWGPAKSWGSFFEPNWLENTEGHASALVTSEVPYYTRFFLLHMFLNLYCILKAEEHASNFKYCTCSLMFNFLSNLWKLDIGLGIIARCEHKVEFREILNSIPLLNPFKNIIWVGEFKIQTI